MEGMGRGRFLDRWGGGFILATVLGLVAAYAIGSHLLWGPAEQPPDGASVNTNGSVQTAGNAAEPAEPVLAVKAYTLYAVQAGLFNKQENAQKVVQSLQAKGFAASVTRMAPFKVFAGAYYTEASAKGVVAEMRRQGFPDAFTTRFDVVPPAAWPPGNTAQIQQTVVALSGYLEEVAQWWDGYAAGKPATADRIAGDAKAVETSGGRLQGATTSPILSDLVDLTSRVGQSGQEVAALAKGPRPEAARMAMQNYLSLLVDYHDWADAKR